MTTFPTDRSGEMRPRLSGEYDALADLFLGGDEAPNAAHQTSARAPALRLVHEAAEPAPAHRETHVEAMLLGSLPIYASAWVTQFVRAEAARLREPVALVRTIAGEGSVDVFGTPESFSSRRSGDFVGALAEATSLANRAIVRTGETSEIDLATHPDVSSIALLTGVDEPAMIAAYRTLKILASRWDARPTPPIVRIAAMGASEEQGRIAFEKIARAARVFLETPLEYAGNVDRIEPAPSVSLFRGPTTIDTGAVLEALRSSVESIPLPVPETQSGAPAPVQPDPEPARATELPIVSDPVRAPIAPTTESNSSLSSRIHGLVRVPVSIPRCERVELAADSTGRLHLLTTDRDVGSNPTSSLLAAQAWVSLNRELLVAACATLLGASVSADQPTTLHLFTSTPKSVRPLLDADIRVHFLAKIDVNGSTAWCIAELN